MCLQVELGEFEGSLLSPTEHPVRQVDLVDKSGGQGGLAEEHLGQPDRLLISRPRETQLHDRQGRMRYDHSDGNLIGLNVVSRRGDSVIATAQQERPHRDGRAGARHDHRLRVGQQPVRQFESAPEHVDRRLQLAGFKDLQVEPTAEHPVVAGDHHRADVVAIGVVERLVEGLQHGRPQGIDLPVVHRDQRDGLVATIGDRSAHDAPSAEVICIDVTEQSYEIQGTVSGRHR